MNNGKGYKQKHHIKKGGGSTARRIAMLDITVDNKQNNTMNYVAIEPTVMQMNKYKTQIIRL